MRKSLFIAGSVFGSVYFSKKYTTNKKTLLCSEADELNHHQKQQYVNYENQITILKDKIYHNVPFLPVYCNAIAVQEKEATDVSQPKSDIAKELPVDEKNEQKNRVGFKVN